MWLSATLVALTCFLHGDGKKAFVIVDTQDDSGGESKDFRCKEQGLREMEMIQDRLAKICWERFWMYLDSCSFEFWKMFHFV